MTKLTKEQIKAINKKSPYGQGIFSEPYGVPNSEKRLVIYSSYIMGGTKGGSCWGTERVQFQKEMPKEHLQVLDIVLEVLCPEITYLQLRQIQKLIIGESKRQDDYYGNYDDVKFEYIILDDLYEHLGIEE